MFKAVASLLLMVVLGCAAHNPVTAPVPGSVNSFDATSYQTLMTAQATLNSLKNTLASTPMLKAPLDGAIEAYNTAEAAWQAYHAAASTEAATAVTNSLASLNSSLANLETAASTGGK